MKNGLQTNPFMFKAVVLLTCFMLVFIYNKAKAQQVTAAEKVAVTTMK